MSLATLLLVLAVASSDAQPAALGLQHNGPPQLMTQQEAAARDALMPKRHRYEASRDYADKAKREDAYKRALAAITPFTAGKLNPTQLAAERKEKAEAAKKAKWLIADDSGITQVDFDKQRYGDMDLRLHFFPRVELQRGSVAYARAEGNELALGEAEATGAGSIYKPNIDYSNTEKRMKTYKALFHEIAPWSPPQSELKKHQIAPEKKEKAMAKHLAEKMMHKGASVSQIFLRSKTYSDYNLGIHDFPFVAKQEGSPAYERQYGPGKAWHPPPLRL